MADEEVRLALFADFTGMSGSTICNLGFTFGHLPRSSSGSLGFTFGQLFTRSMLGATSDCSTEPSYAYKFGDSIFVTLSGFALDRGFRVVMLSATGIFAATGIY